MGLRKAVLIQGCAYNIQTSFEVEDFFSVKVIPMGANICFLEESESGVIEYFIRECET